MGIHFSFVETKIKFFLITVLHLYIAMTYLRAQKWIK